MTEFIRNVRTAVRSLTRTPGYATAFVLTLGLGIGVNTAIFSVVNGVLLQPLPYQDSGRLLYIRQPAQLAGVENASFSFIEIDDYRADATTVEEFVEYGDWTFNVVGRGDPHRAVGGLVTSNYFDVLGIQSQIGRTLQPQDDEKGAPPVAVLTDDYWKRVFGANPEILGQTIKLTQITVEIVGVLEPGTHYTGNGRQEFFVNYTTNAHYQGASMRDSRGHRMTDVFALLSPGITPEAAGSELTEINARMRKEYAEDYPERLGYGIAVNLWQDELTKDARPTLMILMGTVVMVLLLACANVANLTLTRLIRRERELSIRAAMGAGIGAIRRQLLAENLVLAVIGAGLGLILSAAGLTLLVDYANRFTVRTSEIGLDLWVLGFTMAMAVGIAVLLAWVPSLGFAKGQLSQSLMSAGGGGRNTGGIARKRLQRGLVVGQLALSFTLLIGAGLLVRSLLELQGVDTGFDAENVLTLQSPNFTSLTPEEQLSMFDETVERVRGFPGVRHAAYASFAPLQAPTLRPRTFEVQGQVGVAATTPMGLFNAVSPMYFETLGVPILRGRAFTMTDRTDSEPVIIINDAMARVYFPGEDPLGRQMRWQGFNGNWSEWAMVVGVAGDSRDAGLSQAGVHTVYQPAAQANAGNAFLVRSRGDVTPLARRVTDIIRERDPERPVDNIATLSELMREDIAPQRLNATLFMSFAVLALLIAAVGVLGVLGFSVSQRTNEFGIRMALGAESNSVMRMVLREGAILAGGALALGAVAAWYLSQFLSELLFQVETSDPVTYVGVAVVLSAVALAASAIPARRATRVDPMVALRNE